MEEKKRITLPDCTSLTKSTERVLISIVGDSYGIKTGDGNLVIAIHRKFKNQKKLDDFYAAVKKSNKPRPYYFALPFNTPLVLTKDPKKLIDSAYQEDILQRTFESISGDIVSNDDLISNEEEEEKEEKVVEKGELKNFKLDEISKKRNEEDEDDDDDRKMIQDLFKMPTNFSTDDKCAVAQFISLGHDGKKLDEPIIIIRETFASRKKVAEYRDKFIKFMAMHHIEHFISRVDLVMVPLNTPGSPWYERKLSIKNLKFGGDNVIEEKEKAEIDKFINETELYSEHMKQKGKTITTDPTKFVELETITSFDDGKVVNVELGINSEEKSQGKIIRSRLRNDREYQEQLSIEQLMTEEKIPAFLIDSSCKSFDGKSIINS
jgi:hypothetical protein